MRGRLNKGRGEEEGSEMGEGTGREKESGKKKILESCQNEGVVPTTRAAKQKRATVLRGVNQLLHLFTA